MEMNDRTKIGLILVVLGVIILVGNLTKIEGEAFLFLLGAAFLGAYFYYNRSVGFLIPGCILIALSIFVYFDRITRGDIAFLFFALLGLAFFAVYYIDTKPRGLNWPIYPGWALLVFSVFLLLVTSRTGRFIIPIAIILLGLWIITRKGEIRIGQRKE